MRSRSAVSTVFPFAVTLLLAFGFALTAVLGIAGLSTLGSLLGLLAVRSRTRQAALPVLVLPLVSPVIIAATRATEELTHGTTAGISGWRLAVSGGWPGSCRDANAVAGGPADSDRLDGDAGGVGGEGL